MKLLIVTQKVDENDPILGFFCRWITEFAKHSDHIEIICLEKGEYSFPQNVRIHSLGKEKGARSRFGYASKFLGLAWELRRNYDAVFVHMNPEYIVISGWLWKILMKKIGLWYVHKSVDTKLRLAEWFADVVFTASKESFRLPSKKVLVTGHGIDIDFFSPSGTPRKDQLLSAGRLMKTKRHELAISAAASVHKTLHIVGEGPMRAELEKQAKESGAEVVFLGGLPQEGVRKEYREGALFLHMSQTGSLDKVILEALACGMPVITTSSVYPGAPLMQCKDDIDSLRKTLLTAQPYTTEERTEYVRKNHSLETLIPKILSRYAEIA